MKKLSDANLEGKKVIVRVDYNVPLGDDGKVLNDSRIRATLPTIQFMRDKSAKIILVTHIGRPDGKVVERYRTKNVAFALQYVLRKEVKYSPLPIEQVKKEVDKLKPGEILMLENIRFYPEEEKNDRTFAKKLASLGDVFVNDAFAVCHRANASVSAITEFLPSYPGLLLEKEISALSTALDSPKHPFVVVIGGSKLETKIPVIENLAKKADKVLLGGAMIFPFYKSMGLEIGKSLVDDNELPLAKKLHESYHEKIVLPKDIVLDDNNVVSFEAIPKDRAGLDIGKRTISSFSGFLRSAKTVVWNGPMGKFEDKLFAKGTYEIAKAIADSTGFTVVGGGETVTAIEDLNLQDNFSHISTGGGATLEFLEGKKLPGIVALETAKL